jgi:uncharacterized protein YbjT (DUF2867 family)
MVFKLMFQTNTVLWRTTMRNMNVVVLGGSGFLGAEIVKALVAQEANVIVGCRDIVKAAFLQSIEGPGQVKVMQMDVTDRNDLKKILKGANLVVSLVGILYESGTNTFNTIQENAPKLIGIESKAAGVKKIVHFSAIGADKNSLSKYAATKGAGDESILSVFPNSTIFRPSVVFGPGDNFFNKFSSLAAFSPVLPLIGGGGTLFQPVYVKDISTAVLKALSDKKSLGKIYELGGPSIYSFKELMDLTMKYAKRRRLLLNLPFWAAKIQASVMELLPNPILTCDQLQLLKIDNIVSEKALTLNDLGIVPTSCEQILPIYLAR